MHVRDDHTIYTPKLINAVLPKLSSNTELLGDIKRREPALFKFVGKLADKMVAETFVETDNTVDLASKMVLTFQSAILTGIVLSEAIKREQEIEVLKRSFGEPTCGENEPSV